MTLLTIYIAIAVGASFLCSVLEAVLLSVSPSYLGALKEKDPALGGKMQALRDDIDRPLAAILTLNTIAHTIGAAGAGAQAAKVWGDASLTVFSVILTLIILFASEIIPKTLGATYWKSLVPFVTRTLPPLIWILAPLVWVSQLLSKMISGGKKKGTVTREEITALADIGHQQGVVDEQHSRIVRNLFRFSKLTVEDIMTPRTVVYALDEQTTVGELLKDLQKLQFSRIPVYEGTVDHVTGVVLKNDLYAAALKKRTKTKLKALKRDVLRVPHAMPLEDFFAELLENSHHLGVVTDPYGGMDGVATMEDVVETLLGLEIMDEADEEADMQMLARQRAKERAERLGLVVEEPEALAADTKPDPTKTTGS
jgi:CBS domain containing-hemolysin-like protein